MRKLFITSVLLTFIFLALFGLNLSMQTMEDGRMSDCPFTASQSSMCQMPAADHLSQWQQTFTATFQSAYYLVFLAAFIFVFRFLISQFTLAPPKTFAFYSYKIQHPDSKLFNYLFQAFSDGILHPKLYS
ncbi:hypothetical protein HYW87_04000 [Candidatus Roizmanbacteria bacterium]|nr:hypothetical protein [Candidatus Roizmanbacteria bacterium]